MSSIWTIRRSTADTKVSGLCGGVARHWGVDPVLVRVGCVLLALSGGIGAVLYLAGWLLVPRDDRTAPVLRHLLGERADRWSREAYVAVVAVCCLVVFGLLVSTTPFGVGPAAVLALIWYFGYYRHRAQGAGRGGPELGRATPAAPEGWVATPPEPSRTASPWSSAPPAPTPFTEAADAWRQRVEQVRTGGGAAQRTGDDRNAPDRTAPAASAPAPAAVSRPLPAYDEQDAAYRSYLSVPDPVGLYQPVRPVAARAVPSGRARATAPAARRLRLLCLVVLGLVLSGLGVASTLGFHVPLAGYCATALLVLALTLVAASRWGRAAGILPVALLLLLATVATTASGPLASERGWGSRSVAYTSTRALPAGDRQEVGRLTVDLDRLPLSGDTTYAAHVGAGQLVVDAPADANVVVRWTLRTGSLMVDGRQLEAGTGLSGTVPPEVTDPDLPTLTLDLSVDRGSIEVLR